MSPDTIIIGAGLSGLAAARGLQRAGRSVLVLEKSRGLGGRCATRRVQAQPADHGVSFAQASTAEFARVLAEVPATPVEGWPRRVEGRGRPCNPWSSGRGAASLAWAEGMTSLAKHLGADLDIRRGMRVSRVSLDPVRVHLASGETLEAGDVVVAAPVEQALVLLPDAPSLTGVRAAMGWFSSVPCLALIATYPLDAPGPPWELLLPEDQSALHLVSHDSTKRAEPTHRTLVLQGAPRWSAARLESEPDAWQRELLAAAAARVGPWVAEPVERSGHRWRYARVLAGAGLGGPWLQRLGPQRLGLCGEIFDPTGGLEGAWRSGHHLAQRLLTEV